MSTRRWIEIQAPRVGREGRYESIYSAEVPRKHVCFSDAQDGTEIENAKSILASIEGNEAAARSSMQEMISLAARHLERLGLPCRSGIVTVFGDRTWQYGSSELVPQIESTWNLHDAIASLGHEPRTTEWHAAKAIHHFEKVFHAAEARKIWDAIHNAIEGDAAYRAARIQASGIEEQALSGRRSYESPGRAKTWLSNYVDRFASMCETYPKSCEAKRIRRQAAEALALKLGQQKIPGDSTLKKYWTK